MEKTLGLVESVERFAQVYRDDLHWFSRVMDVLRNIYNYEGFNEGWDDLAKKHYRLFLENILIYDMPMSQSLVVQFDYGNIRWQKKQPLYVVNHAYFGLYDMLTKFIVNTVYAFWLDWKNLVMGWC